MYTSSTQWDNYPKTLPSQNIQKQVIKILPENKGNSLQVIVKGKLALKSAAILWASIDPGDLQFGFKCLLQATENKDLDPMWIRDPE